MASMSSSSLSRSDPATVDATVVATSAIPSIFFLLALDDLCDGLHWLFVIVLY
jgi:hypothetical protein